MRSLLLATCVVSFHSPAVAQQYIGSLAVSGGSTTDARGFRATSLTLAPGLRVVTGPRSTLWLGASGTTYESGSWSAGVHGAIGARAHVVGPLGIAVEGAGALTGTSYDATFRSGEITPAVEVGWRRLTAFGGVRAAGARVSIADDGGLLGRLSPATSLTRTSVAAAYGGSLLFIGSGQAGARLWARVDPIRTENARMTDVTAGATVVVHDLTLTASGGRRDSAAGSSVSTFGQVTAAYAVTPALAVQVGAGSYLADPLTTTADGRFVNAGLRFTMGAARTGSLPRPTGVRGVPDGATRLSISARDARTVEVFGDWNAWTPQPAQRAANGVWYVDLRLAPGEYRYAFRINGTEWRVPRGAAAVDDGFGGKSAWVSVPDRAR